MKAYSLKLRRHIVGAVVDQGLHPRMVAERVALSRATTSRVIQRLGWTRKKTLAAGRRNDTERQWRATLVDLDPARFAFLDGSSAKVTLTPHYARAPKGQRNPMPLLDALDGATPCWLRP